MTRSVLPLAVAALLALALVPAASAQPLDCVQLATYEYWCVFWDNCVGYKYIATNGQASQGSYKGVCLNNGVEYCQGHWDTDWHPDDWEHTCWSFLPAA